MLRILWSLLILSFSSLVQADDLIPFVLPFDDDSPGPTDLSGLSLRPAGQLGYVQAREGHFWTGTERLRLWGVNITADSCFPDHPTAEAVAGRLAKFGINAVRFHHLDAEWGENRNIFNKSTGGTRELGLDSLDRLDYFLAQLKAHGIYADLNLLVSRRFREKDGLPRDIEPLDAKTQHQVGFFDDRLIELQKEYAGQLLTHVNPYTKTRYADEPAVALVEITNENGLVHSWLEGALDQLPPFYASELAAKWNGWLRAHYGTSARLKTAWGCQEEPLGPQMLKNVDWSDHLDGWLLEEHEGAQATMTLEKKASGNKSAVRLDVQKAGREAWHVQFSQPGFKVTKGRLYTLRFQAKADKPGNIAVYLGQAHDPWQQIGFGQPVALGKDWQTFEFVGHANADDDNARLCFTGLGLRQGSTWLAEVSLQPGGSLGLTAGERLEDGKVPIVVRNTPRLWPSAMRSDWVRFLWETERSYWQTMYRFLKDELKVNALVMGTIVGCSPVTIQADMDVVDAHAYWQHPHFPGRPWDPNNWTVENRSMVNEAGGVLTRLAMQRVAGKPFTVTEYNHTAPNTFSSEAPLLLAAFAAFQDWDGVFLFDYSVKNSRQITGFFDLSQHPTKMANLAAGALIFRHGDVSAGKKLLHIPLKVEQEIAILASPDTWAWRLVNAESLGLSPLAALQHRVAMQIGTKEASPAPLLQRSEMEKIKTFTTDTGQMTWTPASKGKQDGQVLVHASRVKMAVGFVAERTLRLGEVEIKTGRNRQNWCTVTLVLVQGESFHGPAKALLVATGYAENTHIGWKNKEKTTVGRDWGEPPSLVETIPATITLPVPFTKAEVWALDEKGQRGQAVPVRNQAGLAAFEIGLPAKTLWYEVEIR